ncbi:MAG: Tim44/TimA family putative adaptor protein [Pseudomonadota bacterium]
MGEFFDIFNLIFLAAAVAIFFRLRSVLGKRTGNERPPTNPYQARPSANAKADNGRDNVVPLPRQADPAEETEPVDMEKRLKGIADEGTPLHTGLSQIIAADPSFDPKRFLEGASMAYEMIVTAFANGDRDALQPLLSAEVLEGFEDAITNREETGMTMSTTLIGLEKTAISDAALRDNAARVTVRIESEMITATYDKAGELVDGDPNKVTDVVDVWTFERMVDARDPNWVLVATESA